MMGKAVERYKQVRLSTSTPGELLLALYDGLFRFINSARVCFENEQPARAREFVGKAHAIVSELLLALDHAAAPELCANLASIYDFALSRLSDANREANVKHLDDVAAALTPLREAWQIAVPRATAESEGVKEG